MCALYTVAPGHVLCIQLMSLRVAATWKIRVHDMPERRPQASTASLTVKLAALARGGKCLKVSSWRVMTTAWACSIGSAAAFSSHRRAKISSGAAGAFWPKLMRWPTRAPAQGRRDRDTARRRHTAGDRTSWPVSSPATGTAPWSLSCGGRRCSPEWVRRTRRSSSHFDRAQRAL